MPRAVPWPTKNRIVVPLMLAGLLVSACMTNVNGYRINEARWDSDRSELTRRASFDFKCPADRIVLTILAAAGGAATQVGAQGCDKQMTFFKIHIDAAWAAN